MRLSNIIRVEKNKNYVTMNRTVLNDERLSWKAKGIMAYMLSMPDDWKFYMNELVKHATDGERALRAGFKELQELGYVVRRPIREGQRIKEWETVVYEVPNEDSLLCAFVQVQSEDVQKLQVQSEDVQNSTLLSTDNNQVLNKPNTDNNQVLTTTNEKPSSSSSEIFNFYESEFGPLSNFIAEEIGYMIEDTNEELVLEALKLSVRANKRTIKYAAAITRNWRNENIKSIEDLRAAQKAKGRGRDDKNDGRSVRSVEEEDYYSRLANFSSDDL